LDARAAHWFVGPDCPGGERWPARLVATAAQDCLNIPVAGQSPGAALPAMSRPARRRWLSLRAGGS